MSLFENLERFDGTEKMINDCLLCARENDKIVAFGAGVGGAALYKILKKNGLEGRLIAWSDNNALKFNKTYMNEKLEIVPPTDLVRKFGTDFCVFISSSAYDSIKAQLMQYGIEEKKIFLFNFAFMNLEYTDYEFIMDHMEDFERAYAKMKDEKSRRIFVALLNYKITKDSKFLDKIQPDVDDDRFQYFDSGLFSFLSSECFLDVGAYIGDTFMAFNELYKNGWEHYYAFEADELIYKELITMLNQTPNYKKISFYNIAAWDKGRTLYFESNAGSSKMGEQMDISKVAVRAEKIDEVLGDKPVTFIKMDIEGAEYNALNGMKLLIKNNRPILAICVYHLRDDYFKLTDFIEETLPGEYEFYFRQYRYTPTETVCYAIPKNRRLK